jgi:hypothetical protein
VGDVRSPTAGGGNVVRLGEIIRDLLCPLQGRGVIGEERVLGHCDCDNLVVKYKCVYGGCELLRCSRCCKLVKFYRGLCYFPYNPP